MLDQRIVAFRGLDRTDDEVHRDDGWHSGEHHSRHQAETGWDAMVEYHVEPGRSDRERVDSDRVRHAVGGDRWLGTGVPPAAPGRPGGDAGTFASGGHVHTAVIGRGAAIFFLACSLLVGWPAWPADAASIGCGAVLTESVVLTTDLGCPEGDALVIGADNITVNLDGHRIRTDSSTGAVGVRIDGHDGVTVMNGSVEGDGYGVLLSRGANRNSVSGITVYGRIASIAIVDSHRNVVSGSYSYSASGHGILLMHANRNTLQRNRMAQENDDGHARNGISLLSNSNKNRVVANQTSQNTDGIYVAARSDGNLIARNTATYNFDDGIDIDDPDNTVRRNIADNNFSGFGIEAVPGTRDGGRNTASGNGWDDDDPTGVQCLNMRCS